MYGPLATVSGFSAYGPALQRFSAAILAALLLTAMLPGVSAAEPAESAQAQPDFSGTWVLNTKKGENLGMVAAIKETAKIVQTPAKLTIDFSSSFMGKTTLRQVNYDLAGTPVRNEGPMGEMADTAAKWEDGKLVVTWTSEGAVAGTKTVKTETRTLSADGTTMSVTTARSGKDPMTLVYEKAQ